MRKFKNSKLLKCSYCIAILYLSSALSSNANESFESRPYLTIEAAIKGIQACRTIAQEKNWRLAIAVTDRAGHLVTFQRMDDVYVRQAKLSIQKAVTASTTPVSTLKLRELALAEGSHLSGIELIPEVTIIEGGEPITLKNGYQIGAVGVSGAKPSEDGECARIAANQIVVSLSELSLIHI